MPGTRLGAGDTPVNKAVSTHGTRLINNSSVQLLSHVWLFVIMDMCYVLSMITGAEDTNMRERNTFTFLESPILAEEGNEKKWTR